ncbi:MAG: hypothetical protein AAF752_14985 [Bacteroidota bacterium]
MPSAFSDLNLTEEERELLAQPDEVIEGWLAQARAGDADARERLDFWAYTNARNYFAHKSGEKTWMTLSDVNAMTSDFFVEFERALPRMRLVTHYSRRLLKNQWIRYDQKRRKRRRREGELSEVIERRMKAEAPEPTRWRDWDDEQMLQYRCLLATLKAAKPELQAILKQRLQDPPVEYSIIADQLGVTETALRMRVSRFYGAVRRRYEKLRS